MVEMHLWPRVFSLALVKLRGTTEVEEEMEEMKNEAAEQKAAGQMTIPQLFRERSIRWQLITILLMMVAQQLSGINAVLFLLLTLELLYYSNTMDVFLYCS